MFQTDSMLVHSALILALFCWNPKKTSDQITLDENFLTGVSKNGGGFKTSMGQEIFTQGGRYYFEIFINKGQNLKIGVCRPTVASLDEAFCDTTAGWGIYNGETRHNSNSSGPKYGVQIKAGDIIGIGVDMIVGTLEYYYNGKSWGIAFKDPELAQGELVAAISPLNSDETFTLRSMIKED